MLFCLKKSDGIPGIYGAYNLSTQGEEAGEGCKLRRVCSMQLLLDQLEL